MVVALGQTGLSLADRVESGCTGARVNDWGHQGPVLDWVGLIGIERV